MKLFGTLYKEHRERLFYYLLRMTGDYDLSRDIMQESFTRCLERYGKRIENFALLYKVARNLVIDHARKEKHNAPLADQQAADPISVDHQLMVREQYRAVLDALQIMGMQDRELLGLVSTEALSYRDIAIILDTTENSIKVRVHRARKRLRDILAKRGVT